MRLFCNFQTLCLKVSFHCSLSSKQENLTFRTFFRTICQKIELNPFEFENWVILSFDKQSVFPQIRSCSILMRCRFVCPPLKVSFQACLLANWKKSCAARFWPPILSSWKIHKEARTLCLKMTKIVSLKMPYSKCLTKSVLSKMAHSKCPTKNVSQKSVSHKMSHKNVPIKMSHSNVSTLNQIVSTYNIS